MEHTSGQMHMGWLPDYPDFRDYTVKHDEVASSRKALGQKDSVKARASCKSLSGVCPGAFCNRPD